jgi:hypothetical protein
VFVNAQNDYVCGNSNAQLIAEGSGDELRWFPDSVGGSALASGDTFLTPVLTNTTRYWVVSYDNNCGEIGERVPVVAYVRPAPIASISGLDTICLGDTTT